MADSPTPDSDAVAVTPASTTGISQFAILVNANEILIPVGHSRVVMVQNGNQLLPQQLIEWLTTLAISPIVAKRLHEALGAAVNNYEQTFGSIPKDPNEKMEIGRQNP